MIKSESLMTKLTPAPVPGHSGITGSDVVSVGMWEWESHKSYPGG